MDRPLPTVLVVDDRPETGTELQGYLVACHPVAVPTAAAARQHCRTSLPIALVVRQRLPDGVGPALLTELQAEYGPLAFATLLLLEADDQAPLAQAHGVHDVVCWQVGHGHLVSRLLTALIDKLALQHQHAALQHDLTVSQHLLEQTRREAQTHTASSQEMQLAGVIESAMDAIVMVDEQQQIVRWNAAAAAMFGCAAGAAIGQSLERFIPERYHLTHSLAMHHFGNTGATARAGGHHRPLTARRADGSEFPVEASISRLQLDGYVLFIAIIRDITRRVAAAARLSGHAERLERLKDVAVDLAGPLDSQRMSATILQHAVAAVGAQHGAILRYQVGESELHLLAVHGFSPEERARLSNLVVTSNTIFSDAIHSQAMVHVASAVERDARYPQLRSWRSSPGSAAVAFPLMVDGRLIGCFGLIFDNDRRIAPDEQLFLETLAQQCALALDRALLDDALRASEERFRAIIEHSADGVVLTDANQRTIYVSPNVYPMLGYSPEEFLGHDLASITHPDDWPALNQLRTTIFTTPGASGTIAVRTRHREGHWRWIERSVVNQLDNPAVGAVIVNFQDVTERKQAEESLRQAAALNAFRVALNDALRPLTDPLEIQAEAARVLGEQLQVDRVMYGEVEGETDETFMIHRDYRRAAVPTAVGRHRFDDYGPYVAELLRQGRTLTVNDVNAMPEHSLAHLAQYDAVAIRAYIAVPLVKEQRIAAYLAVNQLAPRAWTPQEVALVEETAERTWAAVARARAEQAVREHQQQLQELSVRLVHAQEDERRALANELHDEIGQQLTALNVTLEIGSRSSAEQLPERLREAQQLVAHLTSQVRQLSLDLRPTMLEDLGLLPTLCWHIERYQAQTHITVDFKYSGLDALLPPAIA
ncbi:MAG: PAS domain S-box protein, partial [Chloroflexaceae bacterium]|nr:PAS domain S-box protein [Chloroflexaceae bacterium]